MIDCGSKLIPCQLSCPGLVQSEPGRNCISVTDLDNDGLVQSNNQKNVKMTKVFNNTEG